MRNPGYTAKRNIVQAERFATQTLPIATVNYGGDLVIAYTCNRAILAVSQRGVPMPAALRASAFRIEEGDDPDEMAVSVAGLGNNPGTIYLNLDHPAWTDVALLRQARRDGLLSTGDKHTPFSMKWVNLFCTSWWTRSA